MSLLAKVHENAFRNMERRKNSWWVLRDIIKCELFISVIMEISRDKCSLKFKEVRDDKFRLLIS